MDIKDSKKKLEQEKQEESKVTHPHKNSLWTKISDKNNLEFDDASINDITIISIDSDYMLVSKNHFLDFMKQKGNLEKNFIGYVDIDKEVYHEYLDLKAKMKDMVIDHVTINKNEYDEFLVYKTQKLLEQTKKNNSIDDSDIEKTTRTNLHISESPSSRKLKKKEQTTKSTKQPIAKKSAYKTVSGLMKSFSEDSFNSRDFLSNKKLDMEDAVPMLEDFAKKRNLEQMNQDNSNIEELSQSMSKKLKIGQN